MYLMLLYLTVDQMAKLYRVGEVTVRRWAQAGKFRVKKVGKRWYFYKKDHVPRDTN